MFEKILVAIDGSEPSNHALRYAAESALKWDAELIILTVIPQTSALLYAGEGRSIVYLDEYEKAMEDAYLRVLSKAENGVKEYPDLKYSVKLTKGHVPTKIIEFAKDENVDLIVMGSRGLSGIKSWVLGSTSKHVVDHCTKPILIVK